MPKFACSQCENEVDPDHKDENGRFTAYARPKEPGSANPTEIWCGRCRADLIEDVKAANKGKPEEERRFEKFFPLRVSLDRDAKHDNEANEIQAARQDAQNWWNERCEQWPEGLQKPDESIVCDECHRHHGQLNEFWTGNGPKAKYTVVAWAKPIPDKGTFAPKPICNNCIGRLKNEAREKDLPTNFNLTPVLDAITEASTRDAEEAHTAATLKELTSGTRPRGQFQLRRPEKKPKVHRSDPISKQTSKIGDLPGLKTGTNGK